MNTNICVTLKLNYTSLSLNSRHVTLKSAKCFVVILFFNKLLEKYFCMCNHLLINKMKPINSDIYLFLVNMLSGYHTLVYCHIS